MDIDVFHVIFFSYLKNLERFHALVASVYTIIGWTIRRSVILMSNASFWMEAINTATFEIESWNPSSNGIHREGPEAMTERVGMSPCGVLL